jgi:hypothetical protein
MIRPAHCIRQLHIIGRLRIVLRTSFICERPLRHRNFLPRRPACDNVPRGMCAQASSRLPSVIGGPGGCFGVAISFFALVMPFRRYRTQ